MFKKIRSFINDRRGNVLVTTAIAAPVMAGFAGLAVDVGHTYYSQSQLRGAVEASALAHAENYTASEVWSIGYGQFRNHANDIASSILISQQNLPDNHGYVAIDSSDFERGQWDIENEVFTPFEPGLILNAVRVRGEMSADRDNAVSTFFGRMFGYSPDLTAEVYAAAPIIPTFHLLDPHASNAYYRDASSDTDGGDIWVNSDAVDAFFSGDSTGMGSVGIYIKGGATGALRSKVRQNMFRLPDLLVDQAEPHRPSCSHTDMEIDTPSHVVLNPGAYCGGLTITRAASVTFNPGIYNFLDGPFSVLASTSVRGSDVLLHFDGRDAALDIQNGDIDFGGRRTDEFRGFVVFSSRDSTDEIPHRITNARAQFAGVVYMPDNPLFINDSFVNGNCHTLCLVSARLNISNSSFLNWYRNFNLQAPLSAEPRVTPAVLEPFLRPYLIFPEA
ncbi:pilus assembly protein [Parasphingopyxis sp.]|uniref:pilus assembly protein n=1 Tax=Parasphingopyxis sp. TaxID=1920299 RepID=UPI00263700D7|nr:pilus assembly protein [Parasphingopyxis sp.]